ncbi:uncharacterized protein LOC144323448 [Canis aureus]
MGPPLGAHPAPPLPRPCLAPASPLRVPAPGPGCSSGAQRGPHCCCGKASAQQPSEASAPPCPPRLDLGWGACAPRPSSLLPEFPRPVPVALLPECHSRRCRPLGSCRQLVAPASAAVSGAAGSQTPCFARRQLQVCAELGLRCEAGRGSCRALQVCAELGLRSEAGRGSCRALQVCAELGLRSEAGRGRCQPCVVPGHTDSRGGTGCVSMLATHPDWLTRLLKGLEERLQEAPGGERLSLSSRSSAAAEPWSPSLQLFLRSPTSGPCSPGSAAGVP